MRGGGLLMGILGEIEKGGLRTGGKGEFQSCSHQIQIEYQKAPRYLNLLFFLMIIS